MVRYSGIQQMQLDTARYVRIWPLHDIVIANIVWCITYKRESGEEVVYCPIIVQ